MATKLTFQMDLPERASNQLITGTLTLSHNGTNISYYATSGAKGHQYIGGWRTPRKGCLPPSAKYNINYSVSTQKLWMPNTPGVNGSFYAIAPFSVDLGEVNRGDFGVHHDSNHKVAPGSAGCIVIITQEHWDMFRLKVAELHTLRIKSIPLEVIYK